MHMLANGGNTEGLFRGAFMESGSPIPTGDITHGQSDYDKLVAETGCTGAADTLQCMREVPYDTFKKAADASPSMFSPQVSHAFLVRRCAAHRFLSLCIWHGCLAQTVRSSRTLHSN